MMPAIPRPLFALALLLLTAAGAVAQAPQAEHQAGDDARGVSRSLGLLLNENPELQSLMTSKNLPGALAYLEGRPPTPEVHAGRSLILAGMRRFDEALTEARSYQGAAPEELFHLIAGAALMARLDAGLTAEARGKYIDTGIQAAREALLIRESYGEAMRVLILLLREKAEVAVDPQRAAVLEEIAALENRVASLP